MARIIFNIAQELTRYPGGRFYSDGPFSGQAFREEYLTNWMKSDDEYQLNLDGTRGYPSSFLEESFGGLVRLGYTKESIKKKLHFISSDKALLSEINDYIDEAKLGTRKDRR